MWLNAEGPLFGWYFGNVHVVGGTVYHDDGIVIGRAAYCEQRVGSRSAAIEQAIVEVDVDVVTIEALGEAEVVSVAHDGCYLIL